MMQRARFAGCAILLLLTWTASAQTSLLPPECAGKTGAQLDQCVRDITLPSGPERFEPTEFKADPRQLLNCNVALHADQGYCIARNEIVLECRNPGKHPDFDECANRLVRRQQPPPAADCAREAPARRNQCALRNRVAGECLNDPWRYFICLGEKSGARK